MFEASSTMWQTGTLDPEVLLARSCHGHARNCCLKRRNHGPPDEHRERVEFLDLPLDCREELRQK